jgi:hypothetical protein
MLRGLNEIRGQVGCPMSRRPCETWESHLHVAILASLAMCLLVPCANARQQSSPYQSVAAKSAASATTGDSATKKTTGTASHHTTSKSTHQTSAKTARTTSASHHSTRRLSRKSKVKRVRGQQKIDSERATSIQEALIREHYLSGGPSGTWDQASEAAMRRYQSDHGWQTKEVPDSRALIRLGLGPNTDHLLNPDSAMTSMPIARRTEAPAAPAHVSPASRTAANSGDAQPSTKPASVPETTPAGQQAPAAPPKNSDNSANPQ